MKIESLTWSPGTICISPRVLDIAPIAASIYRRTCRFDFDSPGFCVVDIGDGFDSVKFRQIMLELKMEMASFHESTVGKTLVYLSVGRFDQQQTTTPHFDGGPDGCVLMLGYEPSVIDSELEIYDYSKCAFDHEISPK